MKNFMSFYPTTQKSENFSSLGSFCPKYMKIWDKKYRGVIFHDTGQWCKIWINPDLVVSKMAWGIGWTFIRAHKSKKLYVDGFFCQKHLILQQENSASQKCGNLHFDELLLSKAYKDLDEKVRRSYFSWHWRVIQSLKKNSLLIPKVTWGIWWILIRALACLKICTVIYYFCQ